MTINQIASIGQLSVGSHGHGVTGKGLWAELELIGEAECLDLLKGSLLFYVHLSIAFPEILSKLPSVLLEYFICLKVFLRRCRWVEWTQAVSAHHWVLCGQGESKLDVQLFYILFSRTMRSKPCSCRGLIHLYSLWFLFFWQANHVQLQDLRILVMPKNLTDIKDQVLD